MKEDSWKRTAAVEFVTIIVGVLVALAVNGAWQERSDRINEREYVGAVLEELRATMNSVENTLQAAGGAHNALEHARQILEAGRLQDSASQFIGDLVGGVTFIPAPNVFRAVEQDLVSTGNIRLIQDGELRRTVLETYTSMAAILERIERAQLSIAPGLDAFLARRLPPNTVTRAAGRQFIEVSALPQDQPALRAASSRIASDANFRQELNAEYRRLERARQQLQTLHDVLRGQLGKLEAMAKAKGLV